MNTDTDHINALIAHLLALGNAVQMEQALRSLLTPTELAEVARRLQIFKLLEQGVPQRQIAQTLGVGIATVTRGSRALKGRTE